MKHSSVIIADTTLPADLAQLIESLEPSDLPRLELAFCGLSGLHSLFTQLLDPKVADRDALRRGELADTDAALAETQARLDAAKTELAEQKRLNVALAERCAEQSELLSKKAEAAPRAVATTDDETPLEVPEAESSANGVPKPLTHSAQVAAACLATRLAIARALASGPLSAAEIARATGASASTVGAHLNRLQPPAWWTKVDPKTHRSPYAITDAGRDALVAEGYVMPLAAERVSDIPKNIPGVCALPSLLSSATPTRPVLGASEKALLQCQLMAAAIDRASQPLAAVTIAVESGLPLHAVEKRLAEFGSEEASASYFAPSKRGHGGALWTLTEAGRELAAKEEASV